ncbi:MAG: precorrin-6A synthase (deacetylating) [Steroidobacteraceae bacterium]
MRKILIIGMGAGHPEHITMQAINALRRVDVLFVTDKGADKEDLARLRREICARYVPERPLRTVDIPDPQRDRDPADYHLAVTTWHEQRACLYEALFTEQLGENQCGAFLVWGDPSLYDSTLRIVEQIAARGAVAFDYEVIPGITSIQALTASHRIALNQIGAPVEITTGRRLATQSQPLSRDTVVLLDGDCAFKSLTDEDLEIYWGAYLGTPDEILLSGRLGEIAANIQQTRAAARQRKGWIMDTYLIRKPAAPRR